MSALVPCEVHDVPYDLDECAGDERPFETPLPCLACARSSVRHSVRRFNQVETRHMCDSGYECTGARPFALRNGPKAATLVCGHVTALRRGACEAPAGRAAGVSRPK